MPTVTQRGPDARAAPRPGAPRVRAIASGEGWSVSEFLCGAGPSDRPFEERHDGYSIAAVVEGSFTYRSDGGETFLHPGALLLGNHGRCFACAHDHGVGDRCVGFNFAPETFEEIAASAAGPGRYRFGVNATPAGRALTPIVAAAEAIARQRAPLRLEESVLRLAARVIAAVSGHVATPARASPRETRRVADALRCIDERAAEPLDLAALAGVARMSKYHFLRVFRRVVGTTPYQAVLDARMRRAAVRLRASSDTIAAIAFEAGFGDLSTFNHRFRDVFGVSPSAYRTPDAH
jgi:AraC-like DNA-binding protein